MPPTARRKSSVNEKEDEARRKQILSAKEKVVNIKKNILQIVEAMLEQSVSKDYFLKNCVKLCQADYNDVIQERSIDHMCGYPLCPNIIRKVLKKKYHISRTENKVYDLSERKCFCSNECYKASNFIKAQLSPIPLYMRKEEHITVNLLSDCDNNGSVGEEIVLCHKLSEKDIENLYSEENETFNSLSNILHNEIKHCTDSLKDLKVKENMHENPYVFENPAQSQHKITEIVEDSEADTESNVSEDEDKFFPSYDNVPMLSLKHMPVPEKTRKVVLIPPLKPTVAVKSYENLSLDFVRGVFYDWITEDTWKYLLGERQLYSVKAELLFHKMTSSDFDNSEKLSSIKNDYINLCLKLDKLPDDEVSDSVDVDFLNAVPQSCESIAHNKIMESSEQAKTKSSSLKNGGKKKSRKKSKGKGKMVNFASDVKEDQSIIKQELEESPLKSSNNESLPNPAFPLVDSVSQNALRRQVLIKQLKSVFSNILPPAELHYRDLRDAVIKIVDTFSLTPRNIIFKPKEYRVIAVILFRILTKTVVKALHEEAKFIKLCECLMIPNTGVKEVENMVSDIISPEQLNRLQGV